MLKYVRPSIIETAFTKLIRLGIAILFMTLAYKKTFSVTSRIVFLLIGIYFGAGVFIPLDKYILMIRFLKRRNIYDEAVVDFPVARCFLYDSIRLGNQFVFCRNYCTILRYTDIYRLYQRVHRRDFMEVKRELCAVDTSGNIWSLCSLDTHCIFTPKWNESSDKRLAEILSLMLSKNNKIVIGY